MARPSPGRRDILAPLFDSFPGGSSLRARLASILVVLVAVGSGFPLLVSPVQAGTIVRAQQPTGQDDEAEGQEGRNSDDTGAESGASQEETESSTEEAGPPWTYQMAFLSIGLMIALALAIARWYYLLIVTRRRGEI